MTSVLGIYVGAYDGDEERKGFSRGWHGAGAWGSGGWLIPFGRTLGERDED